MSVIDDIHHDILSHFVWQPDSVTFGRIEHWDRPLFKDGLLYGDCDDFGLECYYRLLDFNYTPELAVCRTEVGKRQGINGIDHAVCIVKVEGEWLVLDNRERRVQKLTDMFHYDNWARSDGNITKPWVSFVLR